MGIVKIVLTLVLFLGVIYALNKKLSPAITLTMFGFLAILTGAILNGYQILGEETTGNIVFDVFEYFRASAVVSTISKMGIRIMSILTYVAFMDHLKATKMFALIVSKPVMKIKNKYLLSGGVFLLTAALIIAIPNGTGRMAILIGTVYPVMLACGISKATAAVSIFAGAMYSWGPANPKIPTAASYMGIEVNMADYFLKTEWMWDILAVVTGILIFVITSRYFDKKEKAETGEGAYSGVTVESLGIPKWYALLPLIPIVLIIVFGGNIPGLPQLEIATVEFMSFFFVFLFITIISKDRKQAWNDGNLFFTSLGNSLGRIVGIIIGATTFGAGITALGGIDLILEPVLNMSAGNAGWFILITSVLALVVGVVSASDYVANSVLGPVYTAYATSAHLNVNAFLLLSVNAIQMCIALTPATAHVALISEGSGVPINTIIKRASLPILGSIIVYIIGAMVMA